MSPSKCRVSIQHCKSITILVCLAALTACSSPTSPDPTSTIDPPTIAPAPTETTVPTVSPTPVSCIVPTLAPSPTPYPPLIWADDLSPIVLGIFNTEWSPTSNELLLDTCPSKSEIFRADPPDFVPTLVNSQDAACAGARLSTRWVPDGTHLVFSGINPDGSPLDVKTIWIMDKDGNNSYPIQPDENRGQFIEFIGWMDSETLIYQSYAGGGHRVIHVLDVFSETLKGKVTMHGLFHHSAGPYISGTYWSPNPTPVVVSMTPGFGSSDYFPFDSEYIRLPPAPPGYEDRFSNEGLVEGWRGDQPQLLIQRIFNIVEENSYNRIIWLILWDVEADTSTVLADGAVDARFSPDGNILAYLTFGPPWLDEDNRPLTDKYEPIPFGEPKFLTLLDMSTSRVIRSIPVADYPVEYVSTGRPSDIDCQLQITFSPDNRHLTYFTLDEDSNTLLNVLDLNTLALVYSAPADIFLPVWSPNGSRFIYRDHQMNLALLEIDTFSPEPLILSGAQRVDLIDWSFDGQYISLALKDSPIERAYTVILKLPDS